MTFDIKTLIFCNTLISIFMGSALLFFKSKQKTYLGFEYWVAGTFVLAFGYTSGFLRGSIPEPVSIIVLNTAVILAAVMRLDGIVRFIRGQNLSRIYYALPLSIIPLSSYFYFIQNSIAIRTLLLTIFIVFTVAVIINNLLRYPSGKNSTLYKVTAVFYAVFAIELFIRALIFLVYPPHSIFDARLFNYVHYISTIIFETGWGLSFLMMNSHRIEEDLKKSETDLQNTVQELKTALSEIKTLSGLLPICAWCKNIRDDKGYWNKIELYISEHTDAMFTHSICPKCAKQMFPDIDLDAKNK